MKNQYSRLFVFELHQETKLKKNPEKILELKIEALF